MKCPACGFENLEGGERCSGCRGVLTRDGVDYSKPEPSLVDWTESYPSEKEEERLRDDAIGGYANRLIGMVGYWAIAAVLSSCFLYEWRTSGDDDPLILGLAFLAFFAFASVMLWRTVRDIYSKPDSADTTPSHDDAAQTHFQKTGLPPRR